MRRLFIIPPLLVLLLCGFLAVSEDSVRGVRVKEVRLGVDAKGQTRIVLDLDARPEFLVGPAGTAEPEILVHLTGGRFLMGENGAGSLDGEGLVESVDYAPNLLRLRLAKAALPTRSFILPPSGKVEHHRLVIDLDEASFQDFAAESASFRAPLDGASDIAPVIPTEIAALDPALAAAVEPEDASRREVPPPSLKPLREEAEPRPVVVAEADKPRIKRKPLIVLDPGHGGHDGGSVGPGGSVEDVITLTYAKQLKAVLESRGYEVELTRSDDTYIAHEDRIGLARQHHADLFMSIHADSIADPKVRGASVYTLTEKRGERLENDIRREGNFVLYDVEVSREDGVGDILLDLAQSATRQNSDRLANMLIDNMRGTMPLVKNPKRRGALLVLLSPDVPAVLVELAFISNPQDEANLRSKAWQRQAVTSIANGVDDYFASTGIETRLAGGRGDSGQ